MPTRRITELHTMLIVSVAKCHDADHYVVQDDTREPGLYEHECPSCRTRTIFTVDPRGRRG